MNHRLLSVGTVALAVIVTVAFAALLTIPGVEIASAALAQDDHVDIDSDPLRYQLGYDGYRLTRLGSGEYHIHIYGHKGDLGEIDVATDGTSWITFQVTTDSDATVVRMDFVGSSTGVVWIDDEPVIAGTDLDTTMAKINMLMEIQPGIALRALADVLHDENFREEFENDVPTLPLVLCFPCWAGPVLDWLLFEAFPGNCSSLGYQACIDCCLSGGPFGARGCLLNCSH